jgi:hypothetical protein
MRNSDHSPSIVSPGNDQDVYLVLDDFGGRLRQSWRETDVEATRLETVLADLLDGQYSNPVRVIAFNTAEGWSRDVSEDVAHELRRRCAEQARDLPSSLEQFVDREPGPAGAQGPQGDKGYPGRDAVVADTLRAGPTRNGVRTTRREPWAIRRVGARYQVRSQGRREGTCVDY